MMSWTKNASYMKGINVKVAFGLVLMHALVHKSAKFFYLVVLDISHEFAIFSWTILSKCPEGYGVAV